MEPENKIVRNLFIGLLCSPFLVLLFFIDWSPRLNMAEVLRFFAQSLVQALASTGLIAFLGILIAFGLIGVRESLKKNILFAILILPAFSPTLFIIISVQMWLDLLRFSSAEGLMLVALVHTLMNAGFMGYLVFQTIETSLVKQANLAFIEGASPWKIFKHLVLAKQREIGLICLTFFGLCFSSFAVPLILGGKTGGTLEILAYLQISQKGDLFGALILMSLQWLCIYLLGYRISKANGPVVQERGFNMPIAIGRAGFCAIGVVLLVFALGGMFGGLSEGFRQFSELLSLDISLTGLFARSLMISCVAGLTSLFLFLVAGFIWVDQTLHRFIIGFGSVSSVLLGLAFFVMPIAVGIKLAVGLSILFFPMAYRVFGADSLYGIQKQLEVAKLLGASALQRFRLVTLPQILPSGLRLAGVVSFWSIGEYAFSSVVTGENYNLSLLAKSLMTSYRLELSAVLSWIILLLGAIVFLMFLWGADVSRKKLEV